MTKPTVNALNKPKSVLLESGKSIHLLIHLLIHGQGVFIFSTDKTNIDFVISNADKTDGLKVSYTPESIQVQRLSTGNKYIDTENKRGLIQKRGAYYWFSLDSQNCRLYAGLGEARIEDKEYFFQLPPESKSFLEKLVKIKIDKKINPLRLLRDPITSKVPLLIVDTDDITMDDIAEGDKIPVANLSMVCQQLYNCISGSSFVLDTPDFPDFTKAIQHSIDTPGLWCNKKLKQKATEFNPDKPNILETYLRITLGQNSGESPGIPYVMEIWPSGHYSPVHSHSGANAIIRILNVSLYPFLCPDGIEPFGKADFSKGQYTWLTANLNSVHQLKNLETNKDACISMNCYTYDKEDKVHYDFFDYLDADKEIQHYEPDSYMDFLAFKQLIRNEWTKQI